MKKNYQNKLGLFALALFSTISAISQQTYTFTNCGATGSVGPTQTQVNTAYFTTNLNGLVTTTISGIQTWTVPYTGNFRITAKGAQGGSSAVSGGVGAVMAGDFALVSGEVLRILVGQMGEPGGSGPGGGGGGSFVVRAPYTGTVNALIVAGGGTGDGTYSFTPGQTTTSGGTGGVAGGTNGTGGLGGTRGGGGGGFLTDGAPCTGSSLYANPGQAFVNGGRGGALTSQCSFTASGGFGGGSSHGGNCINNGGAGGGFSGGGGSSNTTSGGGGSINQGANQTNTATNTGHGSVIITELCSVRIFASGSNSINPSICAGNSLTLTTDAVSGYSWSTGQTTSSIVVAPGTNTVYSVTGTSSLSCTATGVIGVTVSAGLPVLSIANPSNNICLGKIVSLTASGALTYTWTNPGVVNGQTFAPTSTAAYTVTGQNGCGTTVGTTTITVAPLTVSASASPTIVCEGYATTLTANSAVTNYTWMPGAATGSLVTAGPTANTIYTVTGSDGICNGTQTVLVTTKSTPTLTTSSTNTICEGEQTTLTVSGAGTGGSYLWTPGGSGSSINVSPLIPTSYQVTGTNTLNCSSSSQVIVIVTSAPPLTVSANKTLVCSGATAVLTATGATTYAWTNGPGTNVYSVNPTLPVTVYTVVGTHATNTCTATKTITISAIQAGATVPSSLSTCEGKTVMITASGANTYTINGVSVGANGSLTVLPAASMNYTLRANTQSLSVNCPVDYTVSVTVNPNPTVNVVADKTVTCKLETNTLTASGASTYTWLPSNTATAVIYVNPSVTTIYTVNGTDSKGCENTTLYVAKVNTCADINEFNGLENVLSIFPNPSAGEFIVRATSELNLKLINELGQHIRDINLNSSNNFEVKVVDLAKGIYFVSGENGEVQMNQKIIVTK